MNTQTSFNMDNYVFIGDVFTHDPVPDNGGEFPAMPATQAGLLNVWSSQAPRRTYACRDGASPRQFSA
jgi:hypothetical protein